MAKMIMVVDDEHDVLVGVAALLEDEGFEVIQAGNGPECLEKLKGKNPDLILLDVMMPGMDGEEVYDRIKSDPKTKDIKIAMLTIVKPSELDRETLEKLNVHDYIIKPFENHDLVKRVRRLLSS